MPTMPTSNPSVKEPYLADVPADEDELRRRDFAERIARTLAARRDSNSLVVGLYGPWGEGKTTVLQFIRRTLESDRGVLCVSFNPWQFEGGDMAAAFCATLADALKSAGADDAAKGQAVRQYAACLDLRNDLSGIATLSRKSRAGEEMAGSGRRTVVLMDDVDRLHPQSLPGLVRMLKVWVDFPNTDYILAFDPHLAAASLAQALPAASDAGRHLLDKLVQVPLHLPKVDPEGLRQYLFKRLKSALAGLPLAPLPDTETRFAELFTQGLQPRLHSPRMCNRYVNALAFAAGLLGAEVNAADLMIIEGIRLFYPRLYGVIRSHRDDFLWYRITHTGSDADNRAAELLRDAVLGLSGPEQDAAQFLVKSLFPGFDKSRYPSSKDIDRWVSEKRVASPEHFDRFFDYQVTKREDSSAATGVRPRAGL